MNVTQKIIVITALLAIGLTASYSWNWI